MDYRYDLNFISKWGIKGYPHYFFNSKKRLYNFKSKRYSKKVLRGYSIGYNLDNKFITLVNLKPLIFKIPFLSKNFHYSNRFPK